MSSRTLECAKLSLKLDSDKLRLETFSTVDFKFPTKWNPSLDDASTVEIFTLGNIWASRGRHCRVDFEIFFDNRPLDGASRTTILESLGYHLRDAHLWPQVSLSPSLHIPQTDKKMECSTDISIYINHAILSPETQPKALLLDNIAIRPPDTVLCAEFERLHIQLRFFQMQKIPRAVSKRMKSLPEDSTDLMLLDNVAVLERESRLRSFENVVADLRENLSGSISKCFDEINIQGGDFSPQLSDKGPLLSINTLHNQTGTAQVTASEPPQILKRPRFPKETTSKLQAWLDAHPERSSPTNIERVDLMKQTGLAKRQLCNWFSNHRQRNKSAPASSKTVDTPRPQINASQFFEAHDQENEDILLSQSEDEMLFDKNFDDSDADEMLFSQTTSITTPSLTSQTSTLSSISSSISLKRPASYEDMDSSSGAILMSLPLTPANKLVSLALRTLIAGPSNRKRDLQGIQIGKPPPTTSLSALVPSMFCPGFKDLVAHNSKFLPTISNAICSSWVRNVQGVVLRQKLVALSNIKLSEHHDGEGKEGSAERLTSVVQARLWKMMQRSLYDENSGKKLWKEDKGSDNVDIGKNEEECEDEDLFNGKEEDESDKVKTDRLDDFLDDDEESLFEDLLGEDAPESDAGLLDYLEEQERLAVEAYTEEMLFGSDWNETKCEGIFEGVNEKDELLLLGDGDESFLDNMLL